MMKKTMLLMFGLSSGILLSVNASLANAEEIGMNVTTEAKVSFITESTVNPESPDPENPGTVTPEQPEEGERPDVPGGGSDVGNKDLKLNWVPNLLFGQKTDDDLFITNIKYDFKRGLKLNAARQLVTFNPFNEDPENEPELEKGSYRIDNFVQVFNKKDVKDWALKLKVSEFKFGEDVGNFTMTLNNAKIVTPDNQDKAQLGFDGNSLEIKNTKILTGEDEEEKTEETELTIMKYEGTKQSYNTLIFGEGDLLEDTEKNVASDAITLTVPKGESISTNAVYTSTLTWTLSGNVK